MIVVDGDGLLRDAEAPLVYADDLGVLHGDGVFETILVREGRARLVDAHVARLVDGAERLDLPEPDVAKLRRAVLVAQEAWGESIDGALRIVYTRGRESEPSAATAFVTVSPVPERAATARRDGISVTLLTRAHDPDVAAPWELSGAKALSYARNTAALRHARGLGFDDAIYLSAAGSVLESPRANVVAVIDGGLTATPPDDGILAGTTQAALFDAADRHGVRVQHRRMTPDDLIRADGVWLLSALTLAARVRRIDDCVLRERSNRAVDVKKLVIEATAAG
ncbi:aminodeoxychorismate lyase [Gordonia sp. HY002]|uniref:aminodeoxychorismate lyase n=1 Tax=Gordonia zhenghanii TaxID=2911516 RepID=UPI001EEF89DB|nr:aminodeoxychorismate lyase [Gordonia zhenghanii]MCF8568919.1 aminodeoxychorismate lyase [Gordonia zhenghanii]MCF8603014.1 aminodeoxychorismate lyase [Gordonia zhenghanii]